MKHFFILIAAFFSVSFFPCQAYGQFDDYPAPFVQDGHVNGKIVVGEKADSSDVIAAVDIAALLQYHLLVSGGKVVAEKQVISEDIVEIATPNDNLTFAEPLGDVRQVLTGSDIDMLAEREFFNEKSSVRYSQYVRFNNSDNTVDNGFVTFTKDGDDIVGTYLQFTDEKFMYEYEAEFAGGIESEVSGGELVDLDDKKINLLGEDYYVRKTEVNTADDTLRLHLINTLVDDALVEGEEKTYVIKGEEYKVRVLIVSDAKDDHEGSVKIMVNGKAMPEMRQGDSEKLDDLYVHIKAIIPDEAGDTASDHVGFLFGDLKLEFYDDNYTDNDFNSNVYVNDKHIDDAKVMIKASDDFKLLRIKYKLTAEAKSGDVLVPIGHTLSSELRQPEGLWGLDVFFGGCYETGISLVNFKESSDDKYYLHLMNSEGLEYGIPLADNSDDEGLGFKYGTEERMLWFMEGFVNASGSNHNFTIQTNDFFVLTDAPIDDNSVTRILRYKSLDNDSRIATFEDLATGERDGTYEESNIAGVHGKGSIVVGGKEFDFYVSNHTNGTIAFDLNGDKDVDHDEVQAVILGGSILDFGPGQKADMTTGLDSFNMTLTTQVDRFSENGFLKMGIPETSIIEIYEKSDNSIDIAMPSVSMLDVDEENVKKGVSVYGAMFILIDRSGNDAEDLTLVYPLSEGAAKVFVGSGEAIREFQKMMAALHENGEKGDEDVAEEVGFVEAVLDSDVTEEDKNLIIIGGPCANSAAMMVMGAMGECHDGFEPGKGLLKYYDYNGGKALIVAGYSAADTLRAAVALARSDDNTSILSGDEVVI